jgi:hypothetical protein
MVRIPEAVEGMPSRRVCAGEQNVNVCRSWWKRI